MSDCSRKMLSNTRKTKKDKENEPSLSLIKFSQYQQLVVAAKCRSLIIERVEYREEFSDREQILDLLREAQEFENSALFFDRGKAGNELADAARINVANAAEVQKDLVFPTDPENILKTNGRGILFMRSFMDEVHWENPADGGLVVKMLKKR